MNTDDIIKPTHDNPSSDAASASGAASPDLENLDVQERVLVEDDPETDDAEAVALAPRSALDGGLRLDGRHSMPAAEDDDVDTVDVAPRTVAPMVVAPRVVKRSAPSPRRQKLRNLNAEQAFELLATARTADHVELYLRDGRMFDGAILFNDMKGTGRLINVTKEISVDFRAEQVRDIRF